MSTDHVWPSISYEEYPWSPQKGVSKAELRRIRGPYRAAIAEPIAEREVPLGGELAALVSEASLEIGRFDAEMGHEIAPFASVLLRSESAASSRIENLTASAKAIALAELGDPSRRDASEIVASVHSMQATLALADTLDGNAIITMHEALLGHTHPEWTGKWRNEQVWIGGRNAPHSAVFVPLHHSRVPAAIDDLTLFIERDDVPAVAQAAIAHAQFETIHPFPDGNGRVGRAIIHGLLMNKGLTRHATVPVSAGLLADTDAYFDALGQYRQGNPAPIIEKLGDASLRAVANGRRLVEELTTTRARWSDVVHVRSDSSARRLLDLVVRQPIVTAPLVQQELGVAPVNALRSLDRLTEAGVLVEISGYRRNRLWQATEVLESLDAFADRAGRRG